MAEKHLTIKQQLALLPAAIPDSILDFLQDFEYSATLQNEAAISSFDPEYLKSASEVLRAEIDELKSVGKIVKLQVEPCGRDIPGSFVVKLSYDNETSCGIGIFTKLKERSILKVIFQKSEYDEVKLKELLKNPPK